MKKTTHPYVTLANCKSEDEFYQKYPTPEAFFSQHNPDKMPPMQKGHMEYGGYPQMTQPYNVNSEQYHSWPVNQVPAHMQTGGVIPFAIPASTPAGIPTIMNQSATRTFIPGDEYNGEMTKAGRYFANGGFTERPGYHFDGTGMVKSKGSGTYANGVYFANGGAVLMEPENNMYGKYATTKPPQYAPAYENQVAEDIAWQEGDDMHDGDNPFMTGGPVHGYTEKQMQEVAHYKNGGIHIKPENKGKFTAYKKRTGKTTEEALHSSDPHVRKMANFARNAKHFNHSHMYGGQTMETGGYVKGSQHELEDHEIQSLINQGYKIKYL